MHSTELLSRDDSEGRSSRSARRRREKSTTQETWAALGLALLSTIVPGAGHLKAGHRRAGGIILAVFLALIAVGVYLGLSTSQDELVNLVLDSNVLLGVIVGALILAVAWSAVIVSAYHLRRPAHLKPGTAFASALVVGVLSLAVSTPPVYAAHYAYVGRDVIGNVFGGDGKGLTHDKGPNPWAGRPRINVLLLGGDGGQDREGVRTDSMTVASIDTKTGNTIMFGLPRNLLNAPLPPRWADKFPGGHFNDLLNAVYRYGSDNPKTFTKGRNPGAQAIQEVIEQITGLNIDYYVLVNLKAFQNIVDAIGGIDIYVEKDIPIGGEGSPITGTIRKGYRHLNGYQALWYGRSRTVDDDYHRTARQKCVLGAIARQASPQRVLKGFEKIAATAKKNVSTDIPKDDLPALAKLGEKAKTADISSLQFVPPLVDTSNPDYAAIKAKVKQTIAKADRKQASASPSASGSAKPHKPKPGSTPDPSKAQSIDSFCRYTR